MYARKVERTRQKAGKECSNKPGKKYARKVARNREESIQNSKEPHKKVSSRWEIGKQSMQ